MEFEVPESHIWKLTLSIDMVQQILQSKRQEMRSNKKNQGLMVEKCCYDDF